MRGKLAKTAVIKVADKQGINRVADKRFISKVADNCGINGGITISYRIFAEKLFENATESQITCMINQKKWWKVESKIIEERTGNMKFWHMQKGYHENF